MNTTTPTSPSPVTVAPLVWIERPEQSSPRVTVWTATIRGFYIAHIELYYPLSNQRPCYSAKSLVGTDAPYLSTLQAAQAMVQADWEAFILAALSPPSSP